MIANSSHVYFISAKFMVDKHSIHHLSQVCEYGFSSYSFQILHLRHLPCCHLPDWRSPQCLWLAGEVLEESQTGNCSPSRILRTDPGTSTDHSPKQRLIDLQDWLCKLEVFSCEVDISGKITGKFSHQIFIHKKPSYNH